MNWIVDFHVSLLYCVRYTMLPLRCTNVLVRIHTHTQYNPHSRYVSVLKTFSLSFGTAAARHCIGPTPQTTFIWIYLQTHGEGERRASAHAFLRKCRLHSPPAVSRINSTLQGPLHVEQLTRAMRLHVCFVACTQTHLADCNSNQTEEKFNIPYIYSCGRCWNWVRLFSSECVFFSSMSWGDLIDGDWTAEHIDAATPPRINVTSEEQRKTLQRWVECGGRMSHRLFDFLETMRRGANRKRGRKCSSLHTYGALLRGRGNYRIVVCGSGERMQCVWCICGACMRCYLFIYICNCTKDAAKEGGEQSE